MAPCTIVMDPYALVSSENFLYLEYSAIDWSYAIHFKGEDLIEVEMIEKYDEEDICTAIDNKINLRCLIHFVLEFTSGVDIILEFYL